MEKRLELRNGWAWLVIGTEKSRARSYLFRRERVDLLVWNGCWDDNYNEEAFMVNRPLNTDLLPAQTYFLRLSQVIKDVEEYNDYEKANAVLYGEMELITIDEAVYALRDKLKKILEDTYARLVARSKAVQEAQDRASNIAREYGSEVVHKDKTRREILQDLQYRRLAETAENKTLYEMYDDGYRFQA